MSSRGDRSAQTGESGAERKKRARVYLVGAGPGDPGLLTRKAARLLRRADVVVHDALVGFGILDLINPQAVRVDVGKRCGGHQTSQERINEILVEAARSADIVVRLKGGDPFVFGRGGEEAMALADAGLRFEVVPGVTAAVGVSAYAGIPLTHRDLASSVTFVTGHEGQGGGAHPVDWEALARLAGTIAIYMGVGTLASTVEKLIRGGRSGDTPAAIVEWGTYARQRTVSGTLAGLPQLARENSVSAPALVVIGEVAALRERLAWFDHRPLQGRRILVARSRAQPSRISAALRARGAEVYDFPRLRSEHTVPSLAVDRAIDALSGYDWLLFTSPAGVQHFWTALSVRGIDARGLAGVRVAALGKATADALSNRGVTADLGARTFDSAAVADRLGEMGGVEGLRILFPREGHILSAITDRLVEDGAIIDEVEIFRVSPDHDRAGADALLDVEVIVLPSSTSARAFAGARAEIGATALTARVVAIGPATAETALACGLPVHAVAGVHTVRGVVDVVDQILSTTYVSTPPLSPCDVTSHGVTCAVQGTAR
jgi:uroporphyrinogen III methyltransferase/synthase